LPEVLFSTLGMTDPIRNDYDGPFLHILRHYKPQKAYLFMTKRICEQADLDNRYRRHASALCKSEGFFCELIELRYAEIDNPSEYEIFYSVFLEIINKIHTDNPGCTILINLSSGTPQMKSAAQLLSLTTTFPVTAIQVTTPNEGENYGQPNYNVEEAWLNNIDNDPELERKNRSKQVDSINLRYLFLREAAISNIEAYNYLAALDILQSVEDFVPGQAMSLLKAARHRKNMVLVEAGREAKLAGYDLFPVQSSDARDLFEYLLLLRVQQKCGQLMDFVRGISPALTKLFEAFLTVKCQIHIKEDFCVETPRGSGFWKLKRGKLEANAPDLLIYYDRAFNFFKDSAISCANLLPMIEFECGPEGRHTDSIILERSRLMRSVEEKIRNPAAHNIKAIKEEEFKREAGLSSKKLLEYMQWMFKYIYPCYFKADLDIWESYECMNREIINRLKGLYDLRKLC